MSDRDTLASGSTGQKATIGQLVAQLSEQSSRLVHSEIALLKTEVKEKAKHSGLGIGLIAAGGVIALYAIGYLLFTIMSVLDVWLPQWAASLIVFVILILMAGACVGIGVKQVKRGSPPVPKDSVDRIKQDVASIKEGLRR
jgi:hypothetical protein